MKPKKTNKANVGTPAEMNYGPVKPLSAREYKALMMAADGFTELMGEVDELFGVDILPDDCDLAKRMPKFRKILTALATQNLQLETIRP